MWWYNKYKKLDISDLNTFEKEYDLIVSEHNEIKSHFKIMYGDIIICNDLGIILDKNDIIRKSK